MRKLIRKLPLLIPLLILLSAMFLFSSQDNAASSQTSGRVVSLLGKIGITVTDHFVRKCAHFTEFALLGALMYPLAGKLLALPLCVVIAAADEYHQTFVSGRAGMWQDVLLDSAGALAGMLLVWGAVRLYKRVKCQCK